MIFVVNNATLLVSKMVFLVNQMTLLVSKRDWLTLQEDCKALGTTSRSQGCRRQAWFGRVGLLGRMMDYRQLRWSGTFPARSCSFQDSSCLRFSLARRLELGSVR